MPNLSQSLSFFMWGLASGLGAFVIQDLDAQFGACDIVHNDADGE